MLAVWGQDIGEAFRDEFADFGDLGKAVRVGIRLLVALLLGGLLGYQREHVGKPAGLRTHLLVALGTALFCAVPTLTAMDPSATARVIQGVATGVGFIGGGAILKLTDEKQIRGLTTAASIWVAAAVGVAAGLGRFWAALLGAVLAFLVLSVFGRLEDRFEHGGRREEGPPGSP